ncbi:zinc transporter ZupT [Gigaspora margarita]|uniref:Zinc transporter ZupT n=1 Tax=Gigaspora margarita TaxID=4874 RepID=A0A8H4ENY3_GIGMA|nr:zinc transporter ZupT [Gigaspora margarita]
MPQEINKNLLIISFLAIILATISIEAHGTPSSSDKPFSSPPSVYATGNISLGFGLSVMADFHPLAASVFVITVVIIMIMKAILGLSHGHGISEAVENGKEDLEVKNEGEKGNKDSLTVTKSQDARKLKNLGVQIAIALAIHNFPEGLSTFTTAIAAPQIGIIYAIQLHSHYIKFLRVL